MKFLSILKTGGKVLLNTSAVAGITTIGIMGVVRALPLDTKIALEQTIYHFESPIEKILENPEDCYVANLQHPVLQKYKNDEEYKKYCLTNMQQKEAVSYGQALSDKKRNILDSLPRTNDSSIIYDEWDKEMNNCYSEAQVKVPEFNENYFGLDPSVATREDGLMMVKYNNELNTCQNRKSSDLIYKFTGEKLPYYDWVNKVIIYGEEK